MVAYLLHEVCPENGLYHTNVSIYDIKIERPDNSVIHLASLWNGCKIAHLLTDIILIFVLCCACCRVSHALFVENV